MYTENQINAWYQNILLMPAPPGVGTLLAQELNAGTSAPENVFVTIFASSQYQQVIEPIMNLYQTILGRFPDESGLRYWAQQLNQGSMTLSEISRMIGRSPEAVSASPPWGGDLGRDVNRDFLVATYARVLGREPDPLGLEFWLNAGLSRADILFFFSQSVEARAIFSKGNQIFMGYQAVYGEPPNSIMLDELLSSGQGIGVMISAWLNPRPIIVPADDGGAPSLSFTVTAFAGVALYGGDATGDITILANSAGDLSFTRQGVTAATILPLSAISSVAPMSADLVLLGANTSGLSTANALTLENLVGLDFNGKTYTIEDSASNADAFDFSTPSFANLRGVTITGSPGNQVLVGSAYADSIAGGEDDDAISGGDGNDFLAGGEGSNTLRPGTGRNQIEVTSLSGEDTVIIDEASINLVTIAQPTTTYWTYLEVSAGFDGATTVEGLDARYLLVDARVSTVGAFFDHSMNSSSAHYAQILAGSGHDAIFGGAGDDSLEGGAGRDYLDGGLGDDWLEGGAGLDNVYLGGGVDTVALRATVGVSSDSNNGVTDIVHDMDATDFIYVRVTEVNDFNAAFNVSMGGFYYQVDTNNNGNPWDIGDIVMASYNWGPVSMEHPTALNFSNAQALSRTTFALFGTNGNDSITGGPNGDQIVGGRGNDILNGAAGLNTIEPGRGINTVVVNSASGEDIIIVSEADSTNTIEIYRDSDPGGLSSYFTTLWALFGATEGQTRAVAMMDGVSMFVTAAASGVGVEMDHTINTNNAKYAWFIGGAGNDVLLGGAGNDSLEGRTGNDTIFGNGGDDSIFGADGFDTISGGMGADQISGGDEEDTYLYGSAAESTITTTTSPAAGFDSVSVTHGDIFDLASTVAYSPTSFKNVGAPMAATGTEVLSQLNATFTSGDHTLASDVEANLIRFSGGDQFLVVDVNADNTIDANDLVIQIVGEADWFLVTDGNLVVQVAAG